MLLSGIHRKQLSQGYRKTTNNRMELLAVIVALEKLKRKPSKAIVFSDSKYVVDAIEKDWLFNWEKKGFAKKKNVDLWKRFLKVYRQHQVRFEWVKGHDGNEFNEICDKLAVKAAESKDLLVDEGFENKDAEGKLF
jgi:ribonuclease HI